MTMDSQIKEVPFPDIYLFDHALFEYDPNIFTADNHLSTYGKEMRPKHLAAIREWQAAEMELNKDLIKYSEELCNRCLVAWNKLSLSNNRSGEYNDPLITYLNDNMFFYWREKYNLSGVLVFEQYLSHNARKLTSNYWRFHKGRYDLLMKNLVDANDYIRNKRCYVSFLVFHFLSELDLLLSINGK